MNKKSTMNYSVDLFLKKALLIILCFLSTAVTAPEKQYSDVNRWSDAIIEYQKVYRKHIKSLKFLPFESPILKYRDKATKVKVDVFFKGRMIIYKEKGEIVLLKFAQELEEYGKVERLPKLEGKRMIMIIAPKK